MKMKLYNEALIEIIGSVEGVRNDRPTVDAYEGAYDLAGEAIEGDFSLDTFTNDDGEEAFSIQW